MNDLPVNSDTGHDDLLDQMVEEFTARIRAGETPAIGDYQRQHPSLQNEIHELLSSVAMIEGLKKQTGALAGPPPRFEESLGLERLGEYRIIRELGRGGMGIVFEAVHESLGRRVAIKLLPDRLLDNEIYIERFTREARAAAALHHNNIVSVFGVGHSDGYYFYVMEYVDGCGLEQIIRSMTAQTGREPDATVPAETVMMRENPPQADPHCDLADPHCDLVDPHCDLTQRSGQEQHSDFQLTAHLPGAHFPGAYPSGAYPSGINRDRFTNLPRGAARFEWAARLMADIADALDYAHGQGVLHRDLKPGNLLLDPAGRIWLTDFGLVKNISSQTMTVAGEVIGTPRYMAPESFEGRYDVASETYCLGATLYELVTLQPVCLEGPPAETIRRITSSSPAKPRRIDPRIPRDLATIIEKAITREPAGRYQTAGQIRDDLRAFLENRPISARAASVPKRVWLWSKRNPWQAVSATLVALVALIATAGFVSRTRSLAEISARNEELVTERDNTRRARDLALENAEKYREQQGRADANVALSLEMFDEMFRQMVAGTTGQADGFSFDGFHELSGIETSVSPQDARFLQGMLVFINRFAKENSESDELAAESAKAYRRVANIYHLLGKYQDARAAYRQSIRLYEQLLESRPSLPIAVAQARTANELGILTLSNGKPGEARRGLTQMRDILDASPFRDEFEIRLEMVRTLNLMGTTAPLQSSEVMLLRDRDEAANPETGNALRRRGMRFRNRAPRSIRQLGETNQRFVRDAISEVDQLIDEYGELPELILERARSLVRLAELQYWTRDKTASLQSKAAAVADLARLTGELPDSAEYQAVLAQTYAMPIGQDTEESRQQLARAAEITSQLCESYPGDANYLQLDAEVNYQLAQIHRDLRNRDLTIDHFRKANESLLEAGRRLPANNRIRFWQNMLAMELARWLMARQSWDEARDVLLESQRRSGTERSGRKPQVAALAPGLARQYDLLAECFSQLGDKPAARRATRKARELRQKIRDKNG